MRNHRLHPLAIAAALLLGAGPGAYAQSFSQSGDNSTNGPVSLLPYAGNPTSLDFGLETIYIANSGVASFSALAGAVLKAGALSIANGGTGIGTVNFSGINPGTGLRTRVELGGTGNRLEVGNWGVGSLTVQAGALLDATVNASACSAPGAFCNNFIGNAAGSTGTLTVTGAGSEVRTLRSFTVGQTALFTQANDGFVFGTPGGTTNAFVNVLAGGTLRTEGATVAINTASVAEKVNATVKVDGAGSQWIVTRSSVDANSVARMSVGVGTGSNALVTVSGGGKLHIDGTGSNGPYDGINIGSNGKGKVEVIGAGSALLTTGVNTFINVGANNTLGNGTFEVLGGATASTLYMNIGRDGGTGTMLIDGVGSMVTQSGVGTSQAPGVNGPAFASIGLNNGGGAATGTVTVRNGGQWLISDGGGDGRASVGGPGFILGRGASSSGTLTITGAGSKVEVVTSTLNPAPAERDNYNPFVGIGYDNPGTTTGTLMVSDGGRLIIAGNALSTAANPNSSGLSIGGRSGGAGTGTATVTGAGSQITLSSNDSNISVGRSAGSQGSFNVLAGGTASAVFLVAGRDQGQGTVLIDGPGSKLALSGEGVYSSGGTGPAVGLIGWGGNGTTTVSAGGVLQISDGYDTSALPGRGPGLWVGVTAGANAATGTLNITGAGSVVDIFSTSISPAPGAGDSFNPFVTVGQGTGSTGTVNISGGGKLLLTGNAVSKPPQELTRGTNLNIGGNSDTVYGGTGTVSISGPGSELRVSGSDPFVAVGRNGVGTLALTNQALFEARNINIGRGKVSDTEFGDGTLSMDNSIMLLNGEQTGVNPSGAALTIGNRGGTGRATIANGSAVNITNLGPLGAALNIGGTTPNPLGNGELTLSGGSKITIDTAPGLASMSVGRDGTGTATLTGAGTQIDIGDGNMHVGRLATGVGGVSIESGAKILAGVANIGGSSDTIVGGTGFATVTGPGSELRAGGPSGVVFMGRGGNGFLSVEDQAKVAAIGAVVGRFATGTGTLAVQNATLEFSGQQTTGNLSGAFLSIGSGGGTGIATLADSTVTLTNPGSAGATVNIGGSGNFAFGTGTLSMVNSQIAVNAAPGLGGVNIGRTGTGTAALDASSITNTDGNVYIGREPGSVGTLVLSNGSVLNANYVGIGVSQPYDKVNGIQSNGGVGIVVLSNSTINTGTLEIGAAGILSGNNGVLNVTGDVIVGGTISPGESPGKLRINCNIITLPGSRIVLEVSGSGGSYSIDELIIGSEASFDLASAQIEFSFLGSTDPNAAAAAGVLNLDNFLRTAAPGSDVNAPLSTVFAAGQTWSTTVDTAAITATSASYEITEFQYSGDGNIAVAAVPLPVPEPSSWLMMFVGLAAVGAFARRRRGA